MLWKDPRAEKAAPSFLGNWLYESGILERVLNGGHEFGVISISSWYVQHWTGEITEKAVEGGRGRSHVALGTR